MNKLIAILLALLIPFAANAEGYMQLKMNMWEPIPGTMTSDDNFAMAKGVTKLERGFSFGVAGGGQWDMFGIQAETGYQVFPSGSFTTTNIPLIGMARLRLPIDNVIPYIEGGGGIMYMSSTLDRVGTTQVKALFPYGGGIGVDVRIPDSSILMGVEVRYLHVQPVYLTWGSRATTSVDMSSLLVGVNFGWVL
jgi:hypothetical protein